MKNKLIATKNATVNFARRHRTAITVVATATPLIAMQMRNANEMNTFLEKHNLLDEYYETGEI